ncbi:helix-turn-helix domain-containing protein [Candidatus Enterococcus leclercqii]|uniref:helix-turn-helix domain-containing protein n=1 Tax=Candidatus Enterococcus leclercqii TaxID=1857218 RepID=UPI00137B407D|nr:helix-turn-helix domain-containing protein [Enterococcus sp. CU9D]KAF1293348.1 hypothetical protein BAU14_01130 [Enterococcus sp. CU9D]
MYELLLEKEERLFFALYQQLKRQNYSNIDDLCLHLGVTAPTLLQGVRNFQIKGYHLKLGMDIVKDGRRLYLLTRREFSERRLFTCLLEKSIGLELLLEMWRHPSCSAPELAKKTYHSCQTVRRRLRGLEALLACYNLRIVLEKRPMLQGAEAQIRFFYLHVHILLEEPLYRSEVSEVWGRIVSLSEERLARRFRVKKAWFNRQYVNKTLGLADYCLNERGYRFLWQQLLGLEPIWLKKPFCEVLSQYFKFDDKLAKKQAGISRDLYRLHLMAHLFHGDLTVSFTREQVLDTAAKRLERLFRDKLPGYPQLLAKHPELPLCYEMILRRYRLEEAESPLTIVI